MLCGLGIGAALIGSGLGGPEAVVGVIWWLGLINGILVVFNMIPAFPLDGGRVLRAILWAVRADLRWATRITSAIGSGFGILLIVFGVFGMIGGAIIPGLWFILIGFFLRSAAQASYQQLLVRRALEGEPVRRFMTPEPITVGPDLPLDRLVSDYIYRHYHKMYPVTDGDRVIGCVSTRAIKALPAEQWSALTVADVLEDCSEDNAISADADAMDALGKMNRMQASRLMVMENGHLAGIVSLKDLMRFLSLKIELEEEMGGRGRVTQPPSLPEAERWPPDVGR